MLINKSNALSLTPTFGASYDDSFLPHGWISVEFPHASLQYASLRKFWKSPPVPSCFYLEQALRSMGQKHLKNRTCSQGLLTCVQSSTWQGRGNGDLAQAGCSRGEADESCRRELVLRLVDSWLCKCGKICHSRAIPKESWNDSNDAITSQSVPDNDWKERKGRKPLGKKHLDQGGDAQSSKGGAQTAEAFARAYSPQEREYPLPT